jgi:DNA-binding GntR family transcriptional regulator
MPKQLWEEVLAILQQEILDGALAPGTRLIEAELAERFGTSRGPIREALRELERMGLVTDRPRQGVIVSTPSETDLDEIFAFREAIEQVAAKVAMERAEASDIGRLASVLDAMDAAFASGDKAGGLALDLEFHREIFLLSGNRRMLRAHDELASTVLLAATRTQAIRMDVFQPPAYHRNILAALAARDGRGLTKALRAHYQWSGDRVFRVVAPG